MPPTPSWGFGPFRLDLGSGSLWRGEQLIRLPPKPLAVLAYLVAHAGQVVTKETLLAAVWPEVVVTEGVLKTCLGQIRHVLGETAKAPRYIATAHRRGYRFIAPVTVTDESITEEEAHATSPAEEQPQRPRSVPHPPELMVGREAELAQLQRWWTRAMQGERQVVFVTGEAGIGKTALVDAFVAGVAAGDRVWIGHGQCIEQYGAGEAYLPLLEAVGRLGRSPNGPRFLQLLRRYAPSWLLQLPALVSGDEFADLQRRTGNATRERMLRELAEAVEELTAEHPVLLVLEDLHWSDGSTVDWLAYVARRREEARLLVVGTYRPVEAMMRTHPVSAVMQDLLLHGHCVELALEYLPTEAVTVYVAQRFRDGVLPARLADLLYQRTEGNPLFLVTMVDELVRQGVLRHGEAGWELGSEIDLAVGGLPDSLRELLERQVEQLSAMDQELLEVASVAGMEFSAAAVAAGVDRAVEDVEAQYDALARRGQVVSRRGTEAWVDGTVAGRYGFLHDLHREFVYDRVPVSRRVRWHRAIGRRLELGYGPQAREMAAKLAEHFVRGRDPERAVQYLYYAGEQAVQRSAHLEAIGHLTTGLKLLITLPETPERAQQELLLQTTLGAALMATKGYAAPEVEHAYARARELCQQVGETPELFRVLLGLHMFYRQRAELQTSYEVGKQLLTLAESVQTPEFLLVAHQALGTTWYFLGGFAHARTHLEQGMALSDSRLHRSYALLYGQDPGVICLSTLARALWALGYPDQALQKSQEALTLARQLEHPFSLAFALYFGAVVAQYRREWREVQRLAEALMALSAEQGFTQRLAQGRIMLGWTLVERGQVAEGIAQMGQSVAAYGATGADLGRSSYLALLAEAYGKAGQVEEGLTVLADALTAVQEHQIRFNEAELYRLQGELLRRQAEGERGALARPATEAEACLQQALEVARRQQTKSLELRAAISLSRLWQRQGKRAEAHQLLEEVYSWFTEGFDTVDLQEAKALLEELEG